MSLVDDKRSHARAVVTQKEHGKLTLSSEIIKQIHYMHTVVQNATEWSGILVYEVLAGDVDDPGNFELYAHELIPMDVGSSGYTEYEFDPSDDYSFERIADYLEKGYKIGHIHTHHNMGTFFSGTDMSELHDNAPNHNFYLSLIVDYKNHGDWVAKVAIDGKEVTTGVVKTEGFFKRSGIVKTITNWTGHSGHASTEREEDYGKDEDYNGEETVEVIKPMLFVIDMDIELDEPASEWEERVESLNRKRTGTYRPHSHTSTVHGRTNTLQNAIGGKKLWEREEKPSTVRNIQNASMEERNTEILDVNGDPFPISSDKSLDEWENQFVMEFEALGLDEIGILPKDRAEGFFSPGQCRSLLGSYLTLDPKWDGDLTDAITAFNNEIAGSDADEAIWHGQFEDIVETWAAHNFSIPKVEQEDMHCIAYAIFELLEPFKLLQAFQTLEESFDIYILPDAFVEESLVTKLTGIEFEAS